MKRVTITMLFASFLRFSIFPISGFGLLRGWKFFQRFPMQNRQFKIQFVTILSVARVGFADCSVWPIPDIECHFFKGEL